jgi:hypothetical protein
MPTKLYSTAVKAPPRRGAARKGVKAHTFDSLQKQVKVFPFLSGFAARRKVGRETGLAGRCRLASQMARAFADLDRLARLPPPVPCPPPVPRVKKLTPAQSRRKASRESYRSAMVMSGDNPEFRFGRCWKQFRQSTAVSDARRLVEVPARHSRVRSKLEKVLSKVGLLLAERTGTILTISQMSDATLALTYPEPLRLDIDVRYRCPPLAPHCLPEFYDPNSLWSRSSVSNVTPLF